LAVNTANPGAQVRFTDTVGGLNALANLLVNAAGRIGSLLPGELQKRECGVCFQDTTAIPVPAEVFDGATFRDVLGSIVAPVSDRVQDLFLSLVIEIKHLALGHYRRS
jgi:hypothetical protein